MKIALALIACLALGVALAAGIGALLPVRHVATRAMTIARPPADVWRIIADFAAAPQWRADVVTVSEERHGDEVLVREADGRGRGLLYRTEIPEPGRKMVRRIVDEGAPFGGSWTIEVAPSPEGCLVRVTEDGEVRHPVFRFVSRFLIGHTATMTRYLAALKARAESAGRPATRA